MQTAHESPKNDSIFRALPKVELHRHLEGSLRLSTLVDIAQQHRLDLPVEDLSQLGAHVQVQATDPLNYRNFLSKFKTLRLFYRTPEIIHRITREAIADAAADNVHYLELRFTPVALSRNGGFPMAEVVDWVVGSAKQASAELGIITRLILSANRNESVDLAAEVAQLAVDRQSDGVVG